MATGSPPPPRAARARPTDPVRTAQQEFAPGTTYLNTAALGLPPARTLGALRADQDRWAAGRADARAYDEVVETSRRRYADLVGVPVSTVAVGSQASVFVGVVAASLPDGAEVVVPAGEFTSVGFPFFAQAARGVTVREVPLEHLADAVTSRTALVAAAAVQSADGRLVDLDALSAATLGTGTRVLLDLTQAAGWLPVDAGRFAYTVASGYKWLLAPRGTCFATVRPDLLPGLVPYLAGWYAGEERWSSIYGGPLRLATDARRLDVSPAWPSWVGQAPSLELLTEVGPAALHSHSVGLADRLRSGLGLPGGRSAIVSLATTPTATDRLHAAGVVASTRAGRLRLAFYLYNTDADVDTVLEVLDGQVLEG